MSATETIKTTAGSPDQRANEPSMEEILASIRRIIADDQAPPRSSQDEATLRAALEAGRLESALEHANQKPALQPDRPGSSAALESPPVPFRYAIAPASSPPAPPPRVEHPSVSTKSESPVSKVEAAPRTVAAATSLGHIAAPQFAMPDTPMPRASAQHLRGEPEASLLRFAAPTEQAAKSAEPPRSDDEASDKKRSHGAPEKIFSDTTDQAVAAAFNMLAASRLMENDEALKDMVRDMIRPLLREWLDNNLPSMVERLVRAEIERVGRGAR